MSEPKWTAYNINYYVRVKLSEDALALYKQRAEQIRGAHPNLSELWPDTPRLDAEGYWREQMWTVMRLIGPLCNAGQSALEGCEMQFEAAKFRPVEEIET